ncbi:upper zone of growth plate and cartilage matrix associated a [Denticeps clupeoides]|uniref:Unique cartilage matrix-associated protein n=1 Tax=Denticeps clupeoides TaxID=299321 RepID=A0AAY4EYC0_9TELE|nr:unique cartilage matrix-associated protein [Denticeps clupeoides]
MTWTRVLLLSLLTGVLLLEFPREAESAAVQDGNEMETMGSSKRVFMPASAASSFFKRRSRRSVGYAELIAEQRVKLAASERRREYNEEQRDEYENYLEEERDEQYERTREKNEQWREFHYDGMYPRYPHHRPYV